MTDKQDPHAELMRLADDYAEEREAYTVSDPEGYKQERIALDAYAHTLTARLEQAEQEITALTLSVSIRDARIAELSLPTMEYALAAGDGVLHGRIATLEAQLEAVGAGGSAPLPDADTAEFRAAFEDCAGKYMRLDMKRKGDGYRSPTTMIAFEVAFGVTNRLRAVGAGGVG